MNIVVPVKLVPDLVEELKLDEQGKALDPDWVRYKLNEFDDHAIEQAVMLKERHGGQVIVTALDGEGVDDVLFTAAAKGADRLIKLVGAPDQVEDNHMLARWFAPVIKEQHAGLVLTGVQAHNDLDGAFGPLLAAYLGIPYIGYISGVEAGDGSATVRKEFAGGVIAELEVYLPALLGIQAAEQPPRYVAFSKIRQMMKSVAIEERAVPDVDTFEGLAISRMFEAESSERAEMIPGNPEAIAERLVEIFAELGVI